MEGLGILFKNFAFLWISVEVWKLYLLEERESKEKRSKKESLGYIYIKLHISLESVVGICESIVEDVRLLVISYFYISCSTFWSVCLVSEVNLRNICRKQKKNVKKLVTKYLTQQ